MKSTYIHIIILLFIITFFAFIFFILGIYLRNKYSFTISNESIVLTFVGILAAFVVISNYAQVKGVENNFNKNISKIENLANDVDEIKKQVYGDLANSLITNSYNIEKEKHKDIAFDYVLHAIILLLKNNIDYIFDCIVGQDLIYRFGKNQQIDKNIKKEILNEISRTKIKSEGVEELKKYISELADKNKQ